MFTFTFNSIALTGAFIFTYMQVYQNNATKEYLYYTFTGAEWLVGPDFRKPHAGEKL